MLRSREYASSSGEGKTATVQASRSVQRRRIIERQRLLSLLDESTARVKTLVAPAGYGKTTLAIQWLQGGGRSAVWYTARPSSTDVAALALGIARASSELIADCDARLREHLRAVPNPGKHVEVLAEILGEDLADWPSDGWLVLDEYQEIAGSPEAERFVSELYGACPLQLLIASRQRPSWVTGRRVLYGEVLELNQTALAMDAREAAEVLAGRNAPWAAGLVALANGWPAVIGLAGVSSAEIEGEDAVPESLYRFFAEEVFDALGPDVRAGLATLAIAPVLDRDLATELLGTERVDQVCDAALDVGILEERGAGLELHPLARAFLDDRVGLAPPEPDSVAITKCLAHYKTRRDWDSAFELIARRGDAGELESLLFDALDDLLETARLSTIESWSKVASNSRAPSCPIAALARAEVSLRHGHHAQAQTFAESAAASPSDLQFRALSLAGRAAHLASREVEALELYVRAEGAATNEVERRDALWGQLICAAELELPQATTTLQQLNAGVRISDPRDLIRAAAYTLLYQLRMGALDLSEADLAWELLDTVDDPLTESAFQSAYAHSLALVARYGEALEVSAALFSTIKRYRLDFALPYANCCAGMAHVGMRQWTEARRCFEQGALAARTTRNLFAEQSCYAALVRGLAQSGKPLEALSVPMPELALAVPAIRAEVLASRGLAFVSAGRTEDGLRLAKQAEGQSRGVEPAVLLVAIEAVAALKNHETGAPALVAKLETTAFSSGAVDLLVAAYRSAPELLEVLLHTSANHERLMRLLRQACDVDLAGVLGHSTAVADARQRLTPREREVYGLLCQGLEDRQIAEILVIALSTAKLHAHHVYDKLGVRSRTALAIHAALERADQATSATGDASTEDSS